MHPSPPIYLGKLISPDIDLFGHQQRSILSSIKEFVILDTSAKYNDRF